jgi:hypothetical protein
VKKLRIVIYIGLVIVILLCLASPVSAACSIVGKWSQDSFAGCVVDCYTDGTCTQQIPGNYVGPNTGIWVLNGDNKVTIYWNFMDPYWGQNFIDYTTIGADCNSYTGINKLGYTYRGSRIISHPVAVTTTIQDTSITIHATPYVTTDTSIFGNSNSAGSQPENIFNNILLIPFIVVIIVLFIVASFALSRKKKYIASEGVSKTATYNSDSSENQLSATSTTSPSLHHDVFISYAHQNKTIADAICGTLETNRIRCWIAPRDILPGMNYQESIIDAIDESRIMVLVYSSFTNNSPHITRELTRAVSKNVIIIPFRVEDVPLSKSMEYLIGIPHWLDAMTPPLEQHIEKLVQTVKVLLTKAKTK